MKNSLLRLIVAFCITLALGCPRGYSFFDCGGLGWGLGVPPYPENPTTPQAEEFWKVYLDQQEACNDAKNEYAFAAGAALIAGYVAVISGGGGGVSLATYGLAGGYLVFQLDKMQRECVEQMPSIPPWPRPAPMPPPRPSCFWMGPWLLIDEIIRSDVSTL